MKIKLILAVVLITASALGLIACGDRQAMDAGQETAVEHAKKHLDPTYVCPMHPSVVSDKPGNCPICGMSLVLKEQDEADAAGKERKILYYRHPHNPSVTADKPMKDEMGMDYVPVYDDGGGTSVKISAAVENNLGVRTAKAERGKLWRRVDTVAYVDYDENKIAHIHLRTKGWIEKLLIKSEGERVSKGQLLFEVYAPELVNAQEEYLQALRSGSKTLFSASRDRMYALGISKKQVERLDATRKVEQYVQVFALQDGIVNKLGVRQGMFVMPEVEVMSLADLSSVWLLAEVFEKQAEWIREEQPAEVTLSYIPGRTWEGKVAYVYPSLNRSSRTLRVRLQFDNPDESLKPNMFANVTIYAGPKPDVVYIPREALIRTGSAERVILSLGEGRFQARKVVSGIESGDYVEIQHGLQAGDSVVTSGQFLIDSEASLKASLQRMSENGDSGEQVVQMPQTDPVIGVGILREILPGENRVNLTHEPIPALKWPDMTMYFRVKPDVKLEQFKIDDRVMFELEETADGYVIKSLQLQGARGE